MPIYDYFCTRCGHEMEVLQKVSEPPLTKCPSCGEETLQKRLTAPAFHLKGTGWYATDFKDSGKKKKPDADSKTGTDAGPGDGKSESADKPAAKSPAAAGDE